MCKPVWRDEHTFVACNDTGAHILVCSEKKIEQKHDTGKKLQHICLDYSDASTLYGVTRYEEVCSWNL